jgi:cellulose 1,4-beta-cellobiosidase
MRYSLALAAALLIAAGPAVAGPAEASAGAARHLDNPYTGARVYVNPDWSARARAESGGGRVAGRPTGVWLDSIASITAPAGSGYITSLRGHLERALAQRATLIQFVIYDLPGRDCAGKAHDGELGPADLARYQHEYVDAVAAIEADPRYSRIRIVNVVEPDALVDAIEYSRDDWFSTQACRAARDGGGHQAALAYALRALHAAGPNTYQYLDAGHHALVGWDVAALARSMADTAAAAGGVDTVDGVITDLADYSALREPWFGIDTTISGASVKQTRWVDWNDYVDELPFGAGVRAELVRDGFDPAIGLLVDTSRNGWGGPARPTGPSTSTDINTFVDRSRVDRRYHGDDGCNQNGAGLGERPRANPVAGVDAYVWMKPPGESDGSSSAVPAGPDNPHGYGFDPRCDPTWGGPPRDSTRPTGALPGAPVFGAWFPAQFQQLMANAYPPL